MSRMTSVLGLCFLLFGVASCGGGGGGDDSGAAGNFQPTVQPAEINAQTGPVIAEAVAGTLTSSENLAGLGNLSIPTTATGLLSSNSLAPPLATVMIGPEVIDCDGGGTATFAGDLASGLTLTQGDTLTFQYSNCNDGLGSVLDGSLGFTVAAVSGDLGLGTFALTFSMDLQNLQITDNGIGASIDGDISFMLDTTDQQAIVISVSSSVLTVSAGSDSVTISDYIVSMTLDPLLGSIALEGSGTLAGTEFEGEVSYTITQAIVLNASDVPMSGQIVVTGADGATLTINIVSEAQIDLEFDYDGNSTVDEVVVTDWQELQD